MSPSLRFSDDTLSPALYDIPQDPNRHAYSAARIQKILSHRSTMPDGLLFYDRLLMDLGDFDPRKLYPPPNPEVFKKLIAEILKNEKLDRLKKYSFIYYLYRDMDKVTKPGKELPSRKIVAALCMPNHFVIMMDGFYELDQHNFEDAIPSLTHPSVFPNYTRQILILLTTAHPNHQRGAQLAVLFMHTANTTNESDKATQEVYFNSLKQVTITGAYRYLRTLFPEGLEHSHSKKYLIDLTQFALSLPSAKIGASEQLKDEKRVESAMEFLQLPFSEDEQDVIREFLRENGGEIAKDTGILMSMMSGKWQEVFQQVGEGGGADGARRIGGLTWTDILGGWKETAKPRTINKA